MDDDAKFQVLAAELRRQIRDGTLPSGERLPTERNLARVHGVPVNTVRRALDELAAEGLVARRPGVGTFVQTPSRTRDRPPVIGVIVPDTAAYFPGVLQGIEEIRAAAGARAEQVCSHYDQAIEARALRDMVAAGIDGVLVVPTLSGPEPAEAYLRRLAGLAVPAVLIERWGASPADTNEHVGTHHSTGAFDAVRHLAGLGHRSTALVLRTADSTSALVRAGYLQAAAELSMPAVEFEAALEEWGPSAADRCLKQLLASGCTAALCFGARPAELLVAAARRAGLDVPKDLALISYDDETADGPGIPGLPLTTVTPPQAELGRIATELLLERLRRPGRPRRQVLLRPELVVRGSCGALDVAG
jgi:DNA-binding LacI/PurR family transcriptional regulator